MRPLAPYPKAVFEPLWARKARGEPLTSSDSENDGAWAALSIDTAPAEPPGELAPLPPAHVPLSPGPALQLAPAELGGDDWDCSALQHMTHVRVCVVRVASGSVVDDLCVLLVSLVALH